MFCGAALRGSGSQQRSGRGAQQMRCAVGSSGSGRRSRGRSSTYDEQAQQGQKHITLMCSITAILVRNRGLGTARFAELAAGAGVRACGVPSHAGRLPANTGERWGGEKWTNAGFCVD